MARRVANQGADPAQTQRVGRILVLDDEPGVRASLAAILRRDGHAVLVAERVDEAAAELSRGTFDLVVADLPVEQGVDVGTLDRLRALAPNALWIVLTSYATLDVALHALRTGAFAYVTKPTDIEELRVTVARGLERLRLERELAARMAELEAANVAIYGHNTELQAQVTAATSALQQKVAALDATNQQLRQAQEQHMRFVAMVAHELRGPLALVMNYAQLADRPGNSLDAVQRYARFVVEYAQRLSRLVDDLQTATRLSTGHFDLRVEPCDLVAQVEAAVEQFRTTATNRQLRFVAGAEVGLVPVDRDRILQAVRNLLDNAVKYSVEGGAIEVRIWRHDRTVSISVRDEGAGIPEAEMERILGAFERGTRSADVPGSGLGLYITRGIVETHGGELSVENVAGAERAHGAIITIALPIQPSAESPALDAGTPSG